MLIALGFKPIKAASIALVANTAPVAFGAIAIPITTLSEVTGLDKGDLGAMVGRQTPFLALVVPLILIGMVDGRRGIRQVWPVAVIGGFTFALAQFACSNYISVELTDIVASLVSTGAIVLFLRVWTPGEPLIAEATGRFERPAVAGAIRARPGDGARDHAPGRHHQGPADRGGARLRALSDHHRDLLDRADLRDQGAAMAESPWTTTFEWPGLDVPQPRRRAAVEHDLQLQLAARGGHADADLRPDHDGRARPLGRAVRAGGGREDREPAQVGDRDRGRGAGARLRDEPVRADDHARPVGGRRRRRVRLPLGR